MKVKIKKSCPQCGQDTKIVLNGCRNGKKCYLCKECGRQFVEKDDKYTDEIKFISIEILRGDINSKGRLSYREIANILDIKSHTCIWYWEESKNYKNYNKEKLFNLISKYEKQFKDVKEVMEFEKEIRILESKAQKSSNELDLETKKRLEEKINNLQIRIKAFADEDLKNDINLQIKLALKYTALNESEKQLKELNNKNEKTPEEIDEIKERLQELKVKTEILTDHYNNAILNLPVKTINEVLQRFEKKKIPAGLAGGSSFSGVALVY